MSYLGKWILKSVVSFDEDFNRIELTPEEYINSSMSYIDETDEEEVANEIRERKAMAKMQLKICEGGKFYPLTPIPDDVSQQEIDEAVASGEFRIEDGMLATGAMEWEERNGEFWFNSGIEGEALGEATDPWVKASNEDGTISFMTFNFMKA